MRVLHVCLANFYADGFAYQENILAKVHKAQGHDVTILASTETYLSTKEIGYTNPANYINEYGIPVIRVPYFRWLPHVFARKIRAYEGVKEILYRLQPNVIFLHDAQFMDTYLIKRFLQENCDVRLYVDCHTDFINSARSFVSNHILHRIIYRSFVGKIIDKSTMFFGVTPPRCKFLKDVYKVPQDKISYLPLGFDDSEMSAEELRSQKVVLRKKFGIPESKFVICTGGKFDSRKQLGTLLDACNNLNSNLKDRISLVLFGEPPSSNRESFNEMLMNSSIDILSLGWHSPSEVSSIIASADLMVFPGTHSTLWEESLGIGIPTIFRYWPGFDEIVSLDSFFTLKLGTAEELKRKLEAIITGQVNIDEAQINFIRRSKRFQYSQIAKQAIGVE